MRRGLLPSALVALVDRVGSAGKGYCRQGPGWMRWLVPSVGVVSIPCGDRTRAQSTAHLQWLRPAAPRPSANQMPLWHPLALSSTAGCSAGSRSAPALSALGQPQLSTTTTTHWAPSTAQRQPSQRTSNRHPSPPSLWTHPGCNVWMYKYDETTVHPSPCIIQASMQTTAMTALQSTWSIPLKDMKFVSVPEIVLQFA